MDIGGEVKGGVRRKGDALKKARKKRIGARNTRPGGRVRLRKIERSGDDGVSGVANH